MKKIIKALFTIVCLSTLSSCTLRWDFSIASPNTSVSSLPTLEKETAQQSQFQSIVGEGTGVHYMPSIGNPHILVIPVDFSDYTFQRYGVTNEQAKERINDAFFGERNDGDLVDSLRSYYQKSSYGKLNISGVVTDVVRAPKSTREYSLLSSSSARIEAIDKIISTTLNNYNSITDFSVFDSDNDKYFDAIWLVYSKEYDRSDFFWAFTTWSNLLTSFDGIRVSSWSWASYAFFDEGGYSSHPDAHTIIHETGHLMGLDDYYNYDRGNCVYDRPVGDLDMMDNNIGDHMAFSKYNLGWISPTEVKQSGKYVLKPFESSGEAYIICYPNYNYSAMWEYFILEYYTPTGLNELDSTTPYDGVQMYTASGLRIYHVDEKIVKYNTLTSKTYGGAITDFSTLKNNEYWVVENSNTPSYYYNSENVNIPLVKLVSANYFYNYKESANNASLFRLGDTFGNGVITDKWNDGTEINFKVNVSELSSEQITLDINFN